MKHKIYSYLKMVLLICAITFVACETEEDATLDHNSGTDPYGNWRRGDGLEAYINFNGSTAKTCVNGTVTTGTFNASEPSMTFTIQGEVIKFPLSFDGDTMLMGVPDQAINTNNATYYYRSDSFPCGGGGGGGTGGGGGSSTGNATFWTQSDLGCGSIAVTLNGSTQSITGYYSTGTPSCGATYCANYTLAPGTYSYTASCSGYTWSNNITVVAGQCSLMKLTH